ncbi:SRPBCC family protein [Pseudarthrobacter sp. N5]|uniref:SRPBCC family protein n=1 Tax=Pseudarthrobacter sp. N5 TaxID=3418416 RepID=UPI003CF0145B
MAETTSGTVEVTLPADNEILVTRTFDAPKHLVYRAWTTPELVRRWWGGRRGHVTVAEIDLRAGGDWRYVLVADGGFEVAFHGQYREIIPNERIVATEIYEMPGEEPMADADAPVNTITFTEQGGRTQLRMLTRTSSKELRDVIAGSGMEVGMREQFEILDEITAELR